MEPTFAHEISLHEGLIILYVSLPVKLQEGSIFITTTGLLATITHVYVNVLDDILECEGHTDSRIFHDISTGAIEDKLPQAYQG